MSVQKIAAMCILWQFFHHSSCSIAHMKYLKLKAINWGQPLDAHKLNATPIASSTVTNYVKCMGQCGKTKGCVAINFGPMEGGERKCEMLGTTRHSASMANITVKAGWTYVGPKTKCDASPCPKKLFCIAQEDERGYSCLDLSGEQCRAPLGIQNGKILDSAITASSFYNGMFLPYYGRLEKHRGDCAWMPAKKSNEWLEIDLRDITAVTGVATQGRCNLAQWVTSYTISYSFDRQDWKFYEEAGNLKIFQGNTDHTTAVTYYFQTPFSARHVRLWPQSYEWNPSLRMELYGCLID